MRMILRYAVVLATFCALVINAQTNTIRLNGKDDFLTKCHLVNCDVEKIEGRVVIDGFFPQTNTNALLYLSFDETDGNFKDHSTNEHRTEKYNNVFYNAAGRFGGALNLNTALESKLEIPESPLFKAIEDSNLPLAINFWIKPRRKISEMAAYVNILHFNNGFGVMIYNDGKISLRYMNFRDDDWGQFITTEAEALTVGEWNNVWIIKRGSSDENIYINGVANNSLQYGQPWSFKSDGFTEELIIGESGYSAIDALVDDLYISTHARSRIEREPGTLVTKEVDTEGRKVDFVKVSLDTFSIDTNKGNITFFATSDGGSNWIKVTNDVLATMPGSGQNAYDRFQVKVLLESEDAYEEGVAIPNELYSPELGGCTIEYYTALASVSNASYMRTGDQMQVTLSFPLPVTLSNLAVAVRASDTTNLRSVLPTGLVQLSDTVARFTLAVDTAYSNGYYDLIVEGVTYTNAPVTNSSTFSRFFIVDNNALLGRNSEAKVQWLPKHINLRTQGSTFASASLVFTIPETTYIDITLFNERGEKVRTLVRTYASPGVVEYDWDGKDDNGSYVSEGFYFARVKVGESVKTSRIYVLR